MSTVEIYIGNPIEHRSDKIILQHLVSDLNSRNQTALIFANINLMGRQIDAVLITDKAVLVVEAKEYNYPVKGSENGDWSVLLPSGKRKVRNFYTQTLEACHAFKDLAGKFFKHELHYPKSVLIFCPSIPKGSSINTDFKVTVLDLSGIKDLSQIESGNTMTLERWRAFAESNNFEKVSSIESALDKSVLEAELLIEEYLSEFKGYYQKDIGCFVDFSCKADEKEFASNDLVQLIDKNLLIYGPSGCGKSFLTKSLAVKLIPDTIPIFLEAKSFDGDFNTLFHQEIALTIPSFKNFLSACKKLNSKLILIIDGFNECDNSLRKKLIRCVRAFSNRYKASAIFTTQQNEELLQPLNFKAVQVFAPDAELKIKLAKISTRDQNHEHLKRLLESVNTSLEACIVGELGSDAKENSSQFVLFDTYIRKRLGVNAQEGIKVLAKVGQYLSQNVTFSLSIREYERLIGSSYSSNISKLLFKLNLLKSSRDRVSFEHEMFLKVFKVEAVIRNTGYNLELLLSKLSLPQFDLSSKELILGAIEDINTLHEVLNKISDANLIISCLKGKCGQYAKQFVDDRYNKIIIKKIREEAEKLDFLIDKEAFHQVSITKDSAYPWDKSDYAYIYALSTLLSDGLYLEEIYDIARVVDDRLSVIFNSLSEDAKRQKVSLRSGIFAKSVTDQNSSIALARISSGIDWRLFEKKDTSFLSEWINKKVSEGNISNAQLFILYQLSRHCRDSVSIVPALLHFLQEKWRYLPYSLKIEILNAIQFCGTVSEQERQSLIKALEKIDTTKESGFMPTFIIEALKSLGALELDINGYKETVEEELQDVFSNPDNPDIWKLAKSLYDRQFDHPYDVAYWEVIHELTDEKRKVFLSMVVRADSEFIMFLNCAIIDLVSFKDPSVAKYIEKWTSLIQTKNNVFSDDTTKVFVMAHMVLGYLKFSLQPKEYKSSSTDFDNAFLACGEIYYWLNRHDLSDAEKNLNLKEAWSILNQHERGVAAAIIMECENSIRNSDSPRHLLRNFEKEPITSSSDVASCRYFIGSLKFTLSLEDWIFIKNGSNCLSHLLE